MTEIAKCVSMSSKVLTTDIPTFENIKSGGSKMAPSWLAPEEKFWILLSQIAGKWPSKIKKATSLGAVCAVSLVFKENSLQNCQNREVSYE